MKVNILMSTYNGEKFLAEQIESIQAQTYQTWSLLIRDDGSSDRTVEIIHNFTQRDGRIRFVNNGDVENYGVIKSFYTLLKKEKADVYFFSDQDDVWSPDKLALQLQETKKYPKETPLLVYTDLKVVDQNLNVMQESMIRCQSHHANTSLKQELTENTVTGGTMMVNHALAEKWETTENLLMHDWYLALLAAAFGNLVYLDYPSELYRQHADNVLGARTLSKRMQNWVRPQKLFHKYWNLIESSQAQAKNLLNLDLTDEDRRLVEAFVTLIEQPFWTRLTLLRQYKLAKNRVFHTLVFTGLILTKFMYRRKP